jgi:hypothetical protein
MKYGLAEICRSVAKSQLVMQVVVGNEREETMLAAPAAVGLESKEQTLQKPTPRTGSIVGATARAFA